MVLNSKKQKALVDQLKSKYSITKVEKLIDAIKKDDFSGLSAEDKEILNEVQVSKIKVVKQNPKYMITPNGVVPRGGI